jgi:DNA-binding MarR family transcriptional regulator
MIKSTWLSNTMVNLVVYPVKSSAMTSAGSERDEIRNVRDHHIGRLFLQAHRAYSAHAVELLRARGYDQLGAAHAAILPHIDLEGTRATVIAERAGMTKQGAGHVIDDLERQGLVTRIPDPADKRAALVQFTDAGWDYLRAAHDLKVEIESEYAELLGVDVFESLCGDLSRILDYERHRPMSPS